MPIVPIAAAVVGGAIASRGASKAAQTQANAAERASDVSLQAQRESNALQERIFNQQRLDTREYTDRARADQEPFRNAGGRALSGLMLRLGLEGQIGPNPVYAQRRPVNRFRMNRVGDGSVTRDGNTIAPLTFDNAGNIITDGRRGYDPDFGTLNDQYRLRDFTAADFEKDPGYGFRLNQGREALEGSAAARGGLLSGATLKAITRYGQDYGSNEFGNAYNRFNQDQERKYNAFEANKAGTFNRLSSLIGAGQVATNQLNSIGNTALNANNNSAQNYGTNVGNTNITTANNVANNVIGAGNARASGYVGLANAWGDTLGSLANFYNQKRLLNNNPVTIGGGW